MDISLHLFWQSITSEHVTTEPSAVTNSYPTQMCWKSPTLCEDVSIPVPITSPPEICITSLSHNFSGVEMTEEHWRKKIMTIQ